jgi:hypothetical protein
VIEDFHSHFKADYGTSPDFFVGTLDEAMHAAFDRDSTDDARLVRPDDACDVFHSL